MSSDVYDARTRLVQYHVDHVMSLTELRMYVIEDLFSTVGNCPDTMESLLDRTGISPEDQGRLRNAYELWGKADD
jgi:hypothetical protein